MLHCQLSITTMNSLKYLYKYLLATIVLLTMNSCKDFLDINTDPTLKSDVTLQDLLPTLQFYTGETTYSSAYIACQYIQQIGSNVSGGATDAQTESENEGGWTNFYLNIVPHANLIIAKGQKENAPVYVGIAKVLLAYNLGIATTAWENVPYAQSDKAANKVFAPAYDSQESIYTAIQKNLDEAIIELAKGGTKPAADDLLYGGDTNKWSKAAYTLKARYAMHLTKKSPTKAATDALAALAKGFSSNDDDLQLVYNTRNLSPWYSRVALANNTGNLTITYSNTLIQLMNAVKDPRLPIIATLKKNQTTYAGATPGKGTGSTTDFSVSSWHSKVSSPIVFATFAEAKALEAEAKFLQNGGNIKSIGTNQATYDAFLQIAKVNMDKLAVPAAAATTYLTQPAIDVKAEKLTLMHILTEKYKAQFLNGDTWNDMRRYDYALLALPEQHNVDLKGQWIQRMRYPLSEQTRNSDVVKQNFKAATEVMWAFK
jgi:Starch-binding associating with outer membrane